MSLTRESLYGRTPWDQVEQLWAEIDSLRAELDRLRAENERLKEDRDSAVANMTAWANGLLRGRDATDALEPPK